MNGCQGWTSTCDGLDLMPVTIGLRRHEIRIFCAACRATGSAMGLRVAERRAASVPVARDRRAFRPAWLARLTARADDSWRLTA